MGSRPNTCVAGETMHQDHGSCKPYGRVCGAGPVRGPVARGAAASGETSAEALHGTKVQVMVNGYSSCGTDAAAAGRQGDGEAPAYAAAHSWDKVAPEQRPPSAVKSQRRRKKMRHKKRGTEVTCPDKCKPLLLPPQEEENWENEIQDVTITDWQSTSVGVETYGPEDVLQFELQALALQRRATGDLPASASYSPAARHPTPVRWSCGHVPAVPGQFADAEE